MKYALIQCVNGNFSVVSEHEDDYEAARTAFYQKCAVLSNAPDVLSAQVAVVNDYLQPVLGLNAYITHEQANINHEQVNTEE